MNSKRILRIAAAVVTAAGLGLAGIVGAETSSSKAAKAEPVKPLVRLDLLQPVASMLVSERRNIFIGGSEESAAPLLPSPGGNRASAGRKAEQAEPEEDAVEVQYVGYILSPRGLIGLVLVQGTAQAVAQGEAVQPGYTVTRITRKEIEIAGPDGAKKTHLLQGVQE